MNVINSIKGIDIDFICGHKLIWCSLMPSLIWWQDVRQNVCKSPSKVQTKSYIFCP
jgi:hypothetical protein